MEAFTTDLIHHVLDHGRLDPSFLINNLMRLTGSTNGHFFVNLDDKIICKYSTGGYTVNMSYSIESLPPFEECFYIAYRTSTVAIICMDNVPQLESLPHVRRTDLHDSISISLRLEGLSEANHAFIQCLSNAVTGLVQKSLTSTGNIDMTSLYNNLTTITTLMNDAQSLSALENDKVNLDIRKMSMRNYINAVGKNINDTLVNLDIAIDASVPEILALDPRRVQQILRTIISKMVHVTKLALNVKARMKNQSETYLIFELNVLEQSNNTDLTNSLVTSSSTIESIGVRIVKLLIQQMHGTMTITTDTVTITIKCDTMSNFTNKNVLVSISDSKISAKFTKWLSDVGSLVLEISMDYVSRIIEDKYSLVILDGNHSAYDDTVRKTKEYNIPIITFKSKPNGADQLYPQISNDEFVNACAKAII